MRHRWFVCLLLLGLVLSVTPSSAKVREIDPSADPDTTLEPAEVEKLGALQQFAFPALYSDVSPDDTALFVVTQRGMDIDLAFQNIADGTRIPIDPVALALGPLSEIRWRDGHFATWVSFDMDSGPVLVTADSTTGGIVTSTLTLPGFPVSLAPNSSRVLVALDPPSDESLHAAPRMTTRAIQRGPFKMELPSPFSVTVKRSPFASLGPTRFDADDGDMQVARVAVRLAMYDVLSGELLPLLDVPEGTGFLSQPAWSPDGNKLALVRTTVSNTGRGGNVLSADITQDTLGALAPDKNPLFKNNLVDVFNFATNDLRPGALAAAGGDGALFASAMWSPDSQTLLTQMLYPARLAGRNYPTYAYPDHSNVRFYDANFQQVGAFDRPELAAPTLTVPLWLSPDELLFNTVSGLSYRLYYYNRVSGEFRQVSRNDGTYYQVRASHQSRQLVYNFSSFQQPYELFRTGWDGGDPTPLTENNAEQAALNQVRADVVSFKLKKGATRTGYLIQPAGAAFPPKNAKIVVWQQGGPGLSMSNEWGGRVEQPFNLLPNFGISVLVVPLPGREGFGPQFYNDLANGRNFGQIDIDEQAEIVQHMIKRGYAGRNDVGITGCSYGGYFTSQSITRYPTLYAAANTQCTLLDLFVEWQFGFTPLVSYLEGRAPTVASSEYANDSPLYNAAKTRTPLLMFHGTRDFLPVRTAENFHDALAAAGTPVSLLKFRGEGHGLDLPDNQLTAAQAQIAWFRDYLGKPLPKRQSTKTATHPRRVSR